MSGFFDKLYDALRAANVPDDKARAAAVEAASFEDRLNRVEADLTLLKWMVGFNLAMTVILVAKAFLSH
jgi:hypothetical protein